MSFSDDFEGVADEELRRRKLKRRVVLSTTRLSTMPFILKASDTIATCRRAWPGIARRISD